MATRPWDPILSLSAPAYHFQGTVWMDFQLDCAVQNPLSMAEFCNLIK